MALKGFPFSLFVLEKALMRSEAVWLPFAGLTFSFLISHTKCWQKKSVHHDNQKTHRILEDLEVTSQWMDQEWFLDVVAQTSPLLLLSEAQFFK